MQSKKINTCLRPSCYILRVCTVCGHFPACCPNICLLIYNKIGKQRFFVVQMARKKKSLYCSVVSMPTCFFDLEFTAKCMYGYLCSSCNIGQCSILMMLTTSGKCAFLNRATFLLRTCWIISLLNKTVDFSFLLLSELRSRFSVTLLAKLETVELLVCLENVIRCN